MSTHSLDADSLRLLHHAVRLAEQSERNTHPNPRVGCVIVRDGNIVAEGVTSDVAGGPHAEIEAIAAARLSGVSLQGATAYVSLEPCCHHGRTGPCTQALIEAGVDRVVAAMEDPDPRVAGDGLRALRDAGVTVAVGPEETRVRARRVNKGFFSRIERARPWVRIKMAASLDGRTAMASGESQWITGTEAREDVQRLRARADAILTGIGTVLADNPRLTVRGQPTARQPLRVVVDSTLQTPADSRLLQEAGSVLVACTRDADAARGEVLGAAGARLLRPGDDGARVDLGRLMAQLAAREINEVHTECGARLAGALITAGLVDELVMYLAPRLIGASGLPVVELPGVDRLADTPRLQLSDIVRIGDDMRLSLETVG